eukprot:s466_g7.t1
MMMVVMKKMMMTMTVREISKTLEEEVSAQNQSTRSSLEARLRGTQRSQPQMVHEDPVVVVRGQPLPLSRVLADDDLQEQMTDQEYQSFYDVDRNLQHRKWLETGGFRPILWWIASGAWSPAGRLRLARACRKTQVKRLGNHHDCTQAPRFRARIWLPEPAMKHMACLAGLAIVLAAMPAGALKAYQTTGLQSLDSVLGSLQQRLSAGRTQLDEVTDLTDMARNAASPESFAPVLANMGKYTQRWREDLAAEKEAAVQKLKRAYATAVECKADLLSDMEAPNALRDDLPQLRSAHKSCREKQAAEHSKVTICEADLYGKNKKRKELCNNFNDNYNKIPAPQNFWAAGCEVHGDTPKDYFGKQLTFWDTLLASHDEADQQCKNATAAALAKENE